MHYIRHALVVIIGAAMSPVSTIEHRNCSVWIELKTQTVPAKMW